MKNLNNLQKLVKFTVEQSQKGKHMFVHYSGHVDSVYFRGFYGEWVSGEDFDFNFDTSLNNLTGEVINNWMQSALKIQTLTPAT